VAYETVEIPDLTEDEAATLQQLLKELAAKTKRNLLRAQYYDGKRAIRQVGTIIPPQYFKLGIVLGWSAKAVDILSRRCNLDAFEWPDGELDDLGYSEVWEGNHLAAEISSATVSSLIHGTSFLVNTRGVEKEPKSLIHVKSALHATGQWNGRRRQLDNLLSITGRDDKGKPTGMVLYLDGLTIDMWREDGVWQVDKTSHPWGVPAEPLVYKPRADREFGTSRISRAVMSLHDAALRTVIRMEGHSDVYSFPEMWLLGADSGMFKNADGSLKTNWQLMLGRLKVIPDDEEAANSRADVKQFAASNPEPHLQQLKQQAQLFSGETSIPLSSLGVSDMANPTSADSYIASREDLIAEAEGATDDWTRPLLRCLGRALAIQNEQNEIDPRWATIQPQWRSPMYLSKAAAADAGAKQVATIPWLAETEVGLELIGLTPPQIERALAERRRNAGRDVIAAIAGRVAAPIPPVEPPPEPDVADE
jgi:hypothetical protein